MSRFQIMEQLLHPSASVSVYRESSFSGRPRCPFPLPLPSPFLLMDDFQCEAASAVELRCFGSGFDALDLLSPSLAPLDLLYSPPSAFDVFETAVDLIQVERTPYSSSVRRLHQRREPDLNLRSLCDRVSALELGVDRVLAARGVDRKYKWTEEIKAPEKSGGLEKKYKWTAEIKAPEKSGGLEKKYKCVAEVKAGKCKTAPAEKSYKWTTEIKGKGADGPIIKTYTFQSSTAPAGGAALTERSEKNEKKEKKVKKSKTQLVEIEDADPAALELKQLFAKRKDLASKNVKGKKKELSPQDAAILIQVTFRTHLVRRSKALCELRELAVAKTKLKELRALFHNFSYRRHIACNTEEHQRFSEKIIVLLLTVDAIEGSDLMVRSAKKSMVDELEAMLEVVDPRPPGKLGSLKRRKFDLPEGPLQKEIALGVAEVVQMLDQEENGSSSFEAAL